jgi:hypothetical protein
MSKLHKDAAALGMHGIRNTPPSLALLSAVDAGCAEPASNLLADKGSFTDDESRRSALPWAQYSSALQATAALCSMP